MNRSWKTSPGESATPGVRRLVSDVVFKFAAVGVVAVMIGTLFGVLWFVVAREFRAWTPQESPSGVSSGLLSPYAVLVAIAAIA